MESMTAIDVVHAKGAAWIWMNRPERHNAFDEHLIEGLTATLRQLGEDDAIRAVVLAGRGKSFSAGADIDWMRRQGEAPEDRNREDALRLAELFRILSTLQKPTIARVQGAAVGGGLGLAAACDIVVATPAASFAMPEVRLGIIPAVISPYVADAIGARQCRRYMLTGERIAAADAFRLGLVHEVADEAELDKVVEGFVTALEQSAPGAVAEAKDLLAAISHRPRDSALLEETAERLVKRRATREAQEGLAAFLAKRTPSWVPPQ